MLKAIELGDYVMTVLDDSGLVVHGIIVGFDRDDYAIVTAKDYETDLLVPLENVRVMN